jgi:hypothetical protein
LAHWTRAQIWLQQGDLDRGWQEYSWRSRVAGQTVPHEPIPVWNGSALDQSSILVHGACAQNDMLLLSACLPEIISRARRTLITCAAQLEQLLARSFPDADVCAIEPASSRLPAEAPACDVQIRLDQLPQMLHFGADEFRQRRVPLATDPEQVAHWRRWLDEHGSGPRIGLLWRGRHKANIRPDTSRAPGLEHWRPLLSTPGVQFVSLLPGANAEDFARICGGGPDPISLPNANDLDTLAAQLAALDLVITIDDLTAHLAASLAQEVWLVLPHAWGWQWPLGQQLCPWYASARMFRPQRLNSWPELMSRLAEQLNAWREAKPQEGLDAGHAQPNRPHVVTPTSQSGPARLTMKHGSPHHRAQIREHRPQI